MKRVWRWGKRLFLACALLVVLAIVLRDVIARFCLTEAIQNQTGLRTRIGHVHIGLLYPEISIENLALYNTPVFGGSNFIEMPELHVEYDRDALFSRRLHCTFIRFNLARLNIVEDAHGRRNVDFFGPAAPAHRSATSGSAPSPKSPPSRNASEEFQFAGIDKLNLTLGKATYVELAHPEQVDVLDMNCNHQNFAAIRGLEDVEGLSFVLTLKSRSSVRPDGTMRDWTRVFMPQKR